MAETGGERADGSPLVPPARRSLWRSRACAAALLAVVPLLFTAHGLVPGRLLLPADIVETLGAWKADPNERRPPANHTLSDVVLQFVPWDVEARRQLARGEIPWRDRFSGLDTPLLANPQSALLSPFTWPRLAFGLDGWGLSVFLRFLVAGVGMLWLAREMGAGRGPALVSAIAYQASAYLVVWAMHPHTNVSATMPLFAAALLRLLRGVRPGRVLAVVATAALTSAGGHPESLATGVLAVVVLAVWQAKRGGASRRLAWGLAAAASGFLALAVVYVPFWAAVLDSQVFADRGSAPVYELRTSAIVAQVLPGAQGGPLGDELDLTRLWHPEEEFPARTTAFVGLLFLLALVAGWRGVPSLMRRGLAVGAACLLLSWCLPGIEHLVGNLPLLAHTLPPYRALGFVLFASAAAGPALWALTAAPRRRTGAALAVCGVLGIVAGLAPSFASGRPLVDAASRQAIAALARQDLLPNSAAVYEGRLPVYIDAIAATARRRLALPGVAWLLAGFALTAAGTWRRRALTVAAAAGELLAFGFGYLPATPSGELPGVPATLAAIRRADPQLTHAFVAGPGILPPNLGTLFAIPDLRSYTVLEKRDHLELLERAGYETTAPLSFPAELSARQRRLLAGAGVRFVLSREPVTGARRLTGDRPPEVGLYELQGAVPRAKPISGPPAGGLAGLGVSAAGLGMALLLAVWAGRARDTGAR